MGSPIFGSSTPCSIVRLKPDILKAPHHWPFVRGIHRWLVASPHKGPAMCKACPCHYVITDELVWDSRYVKVQSCWGIRMTRDSSVCHKYIFTITYTLRNNPWPARWNTLVSRLYIATIVDFGKAPYQHQHFSLMSTISFEWHKWN